MRAPLHWSVQRKVYFSISLPQITLILLFRSEKIHFCFLQDFWNACAGARIPICMKFSFFTGLDICPLSHIVPSPSRFLKSVCVFVNLRLRHSERCRIRAGQVNGKLKFEFRKAEWGTIYSSKESIAHSNIGPPNNLPSTNPLNSSPQFPNSLIPSTQFRGPHPASQPYRSCKSRDFSPTPKTGSAVSRGALAP